jgi:hypothetical protein
MVRINLAFGHDDSALHIVAPPIFHVAAHLGCAETARMRVCPGHVTGGAKG